MSKQTKHTPGPWQINDARGCRWIETPKDDVIARVYKDACSRETFDANSNLISAAPDLLAALTAMLEITDFHELFGSKTEAARAAIAKATGATHD